MSGGAASRGAITPRQPHQRAARPRHVHKHGVPVVREVPAGARRAHRHRAVPRRRTPATPARPLPGQGVWGWTPAGGAVAGARGCRARAVFGTTSAGGVGRGGRWGVPHMTRATRGRRRGPPAPPAAPPAAWGWRGGPWVRLAPPPRARAACVSERWGGMPRCRVRTRAATTRDAETDRAAAAGPRGHFLPAPPPARRLPGRPGSCPGWRAGGAPYSLPVAETAATLRVGQINHGRGFTAFD